MLDWEKGVTLNHGNRRWATAWTQMNPECNWDDIKSTSNFFFTVRTMIELYVSALSVHYACEHVSAV